jgi:hypothetical protein
MTPPERRRFVSWPAFGSFIAALCLLTGNPTLNAGSECVIVGPASVRHFLNRRRTNRTELMRLPTRLAALACVLILVPAASRASDCRQRTTGDICASGSPWSEFTRFRVEPRDENAPTTTLTVHDAQDFSLDINPKGAATSKGRILLIAGRAMLMRSVAQEAGYEIDALDGPVLTHQLVMTLLDQAFPKGSGSVGSSKPSFKIMQRQRAIRIATSSAEGRIEAPWTLTGTARQVDGRIVYDIQLEFAAQDGPKSISFAGFWEKAAERAPLDGWMSLEGWTIHWLGPMTTSSDQGTTLDYAAQPVSERWADLGSLRKYIADEPSRRAGRRTPADAANPGGPESISYEAFELSKQGVRRRLGEGVRKYRPGSDVLVEKTRSMASTKTLSLGYGLSISSDVYREKELNGFGLVLIRDDSPAFSWEWFNRERDDVFRKLLGGGKVRVSVSVSGEFQELVAVEFLDDITLRCTDKQTGTTHEVRVLKGSVFRVAP